MVNGGSDGTDTTSLTAVPESASYTLFNRNGGQTFNGFMAELMIFNTVIGSNELTRITAYLSKKWNLTATVDSDGDGIMDALDGQPTNPNEQLLIPDFSDSYDAVMGEASGLGGIEGNVTLWFDATNANARGNSGLTDGQAISTWNNLVNPSEALVVSGGSGSITFQQSIPGIALNQKGMQTTDRAAIQTIVMVHEGSSESSIGSYLLDLRDMNMNHVAYIFDGRTTNYKHLGSWVSGLTINNNSISGGQLNSVQVNDLIFNNTKQITIIESNELVTAPFYLFERFNATGQAIGSMHEVIAFNRSLTDDEKKALKQAMAKKWGIEGIGTQDFNDDTVLNAARNFGQEKVRFLGKNNRIERSVVIDFDDVELGTNNQADMSILDVLGEMNGRIMAMSNKSRFNLANDARIDMSEAITIDDGAEVTLKGHVNAPKITGRFNVGGGAAIHITDVLGDITATGDDDGEFAITANVVEGNVDLSKGRGVFGRMKGNITLQSASSARITSIEGLVRVNGDANSRVAVDHVTGNVEIVNGQLAPGDSPGMTTIVGSYTQSSDGVLEIEIAGINADVPEFDQLKVSETATLNGELRVVLLDGYVPTIGHEFAIITAATITGNFQTLTLPPLAEGIRWNADDVATIGILRLENDPLNQPIALAAPETATVNEDELLTFSSIQVSDIGDVNADDGITYDTLTASMNIGVSHGVIQLSSTNGITFLDDTANGQAQVMIQGSITALNTVLNGMTYDSNDNFHTLKVTENMTITVNDLANGGRGGATIATASISISITPVNDALSAGDAFDPSHSSVSLPTISMGGASIELSNEDAYQTPDGAYIYVFKYDANNDNGQGQTEYDLSFDGDTVADVLIVGGGGGGGTGSNTSSGVGGAGGGAGGLIYEQGHIFSSGAHSIKVGGGGTGAVVNSTNKGTNGTNSEIGNLIAIGGGAGGKRVNSPNGNSGGSGGGTTGGTPGLALQPTSESGGAGNPGGVSISNSPSGGGGAGEPGYDADRDDIDVRGHGGNGLEINITGEAIFYAGGGGAAKGFGSTHPNDNGDGGLGGGGHGWDQVDHVTTTDINGKDHTGGGGGGGSPNSEGVSGGNGGSGIIIIRINQPIDMMANEDESVALSAISLDESRDITDENGVVTADINISVSLQANHSDIEVVDTTGITFMDGSANNSPSVTFEGAMDKVQTALDSIVIRPPAGFTGSDSIAVDISDLSNGGSGTAQTISNTFIIRVSAVNDPIDIALPAEPTVNEDNSITITGIAVSDDGDVNASQGITNDTLTARVTLDVDHGFMALNSLDDITVVESEGGEFDISSIDGLTLWLDSNDESSITYSGETITKWSDKSAYGNDYVQDAGSVTMGADGVYFDGASQLVGTKTNFDGGGQTYAFFVVIKANSDTSGDGIVWTNTSYGIPLIDLHIAGTKYNLRTRDSDYHTLPSNSNMSYDAHDIVSLERDDVSVFMNVNGIEENSKELPSDFYVDDHVTRIGGYNGSSYSFKGHIAEMIVINRG